MCSDDLSYDDLCRLVRSEDAKQRLIALKAMRAKWPEQHPEYIGLAKLLVSDVDNDCRWQSLNVLNDYAKDYRDVAWKIVLEHGTSEDEDMRDAIATMLLEKLLEWHFSWVMPRLEAAIPASPLLANTLRRCWPCGEAENRWSEVENLLVKVGERDTPRDWKPFNSSSR